MKDTETRVQELENQVTKLTNIVRELQEQLILLPDIARYNQLQNLLKNGDLKAADIETTRIMLEVAGVERENLTPDDVSKYPCNSLKVIDQMWQKYTNQKFGFSVQLKSYYEAGGNIDTIRAQDVTVLKKFADQEEKYEVKYQENQSIIELENKKEDKNSTKIKVSFVLSKNRKNLKKSYFKRFAEKFILINDNGGDRS